MLKSKSSSRGGNTKCTRVNDEANAVNTTKRNLYVSNKILFAKANIDNAKSDNSLVRNFKEQFKYRAK